jgi:NADH-ubiquinone oxidoreductase chain 5
VSQLVLNLGGQTTKFIDKGSIEYIGPYGLEVGLSFLSKKLSNLDSGLVTSYALYILSGFILYIYI